MFNCFIGIDPGVQGGIAMIDVDGVRAWKMPDTEAGVAELLRWFAAAYTVRNIACQAVMERVRSSPQMGVVSAFKFGWSYGLLRGCLLSLQVPLDEVLPQRWQRELGCLSKGDKNVTKQRAQQLFPQVKVTHYVADALLIAEYARRVYSTKGGGHG